MKDGQKRCTPRQQASGGATSAAQNAQIQSWIDNVIVPILVQQILKTPPKLVSTSASILVNPRAS
jgi:hypothetical protein